MQYNEPLISLYANKFMNENFVKSNFFYDAH